MKTIRLIFLPFLLLLAGVEPAMACWYAPKTLAQGDQPQLKTEGAPSLLIVSAPAKFDREKKKVKISLEVKNIGSKTIKAFIWDYGAEGVIQGYKVLSRADMFEVSLNLPPNGQKKVALLQGSASGVFWDLPVREIRIVSVTFEDGSSWGRDKDK